MASGGGDGAAFVGVAGVAGGGVGVGSMVGLACGAVGGTGVFGAAVGLAATVAWTAAGDGGVVGEGGGVAPPHPARTITATNSPSQPIERRCRVTNDFLSLAVPRRTRLQAAPAATVYFAADQPESLVGARQCAGNRKQTTRREK